MIVNTLAALWNRARHSAMFVGLISTGLRMGANLLLLPVVLNQLSTPEFALWVVFVSLAALGNLADFGFGQVVARIYSYLWAGADDFESQGLKPITGAKEPNIPRLHEFNHAVGKLYLRISLIAAALLLLIGPWFVAPSRSEFSSALALWGLWAGYIFAIVYSLCTSYWLVACQGINRVRETQTIHLYASFAFMGSAIALLFLKFGLFAMVIATFLRAFITHQMSKSAYYKAAPMTVPSQNLQPRAPAEMLKRLWPNAWKFGLISLAVYLVHNGTVLISRKLLSDEETASFGLTAQVANVLVNLAALWLVVKWPQITILRAQGDLREMSTLFARRLTLVSISYIALATLLVLFGNHALSILKGNEIHFIPTPILILYLAYIGQQTFMSQFVTLTYTENVVPYYLISIFTGLGLVALSIPLTMKYGLWGLVAAPLLASLPATAWYPIYRGFKGQPLTLRQFLRAAFFQKSFSS